MGVDCNMPAPPMGQGSWPGYSHRGHHGSLLPFCQGESTSQTQVLVLLALGTSLAGNQVDVVTAEETPHILPCSRLEYRNL